MFWQSLISSVLTVIKVMALGEATGHKVVRINLSEQTDMMDLLGADLPADSNISDGTLRIGR